ncbi:MAG: PaaI family thioesterase [Solirubrobacteraceae bacterium]
MAPWREPVRGGHPSAALDARPGIELVRGLANGDIPAPPISRLTGMQVVALGDGHATFTLPLGPWLHGPDGRVSLGPLTIPADAAMATAAITRLGPRVGLTTSELALRQLQPAPTDGVVTAAATVIDAQPRAILIEARLTASDGTLIAHGSSLCVTVPAPGPTGAPDGPASRAAPAAETPDGAGRGQETRPLTAVTDDSPDPWQRPQPEAWATSPSGPIGVLTGLRLVSAGGGRATCALPASAWLCAPPPGRVQGGMVATLAEAAITAAIRDTSRAARMRPLELKLNYLRPLSSDGREAIAQARVVHPGRRIAVASVEVRDADERLIAVGSGSAIAGG